MCVRQQAVSSVECASLSLDCRHNRPFPLRRCRHPCLPLQPRTASPPRPSNNSIHTGSPSGRLALTLIWSPTPSSSPSPAPRIFGTLLHPAETPPVPPPTTLPSPTDPPRHLPSLTPRTMPAAHPRAPSFPRWLQLPPPPIKATTGNFPRPSPTLSAPARSPPPCSPVHSKAPTLSPICLLTPPRSVPV